MAAATTSGRQLELVLGVAGSGKTTALDALRDAYETADLKLANAPDLPVETITL